MHGGVSLQRGQTQIAALGFEGNGVGNDRANPKASIELAVLDISILAQVNVEHAIESVEGHNRKGCFNWPFNGACSSLKCKTTPVD